MSFFISDALAQEGQQAGTLELILPLLLMFGIFYFLLIRPQQKKAKEHRSMVEALNKGDEIEVKVIEVKPRDDGDGFRIGLSRKALLEKPEGLEDWDGPYLFVDTELSEDGEVLDAYGQIAQWYCVAKTVLSEGNRRQESKSQRKRNSSHNSHPLITILEQHRWETIR